VCCIASIHRIRRYGEPRLCKPGADQQFAQLFEAHAASQLLEDQLHVLHPLASRQYLSPRVVNLALQYLTRALELKGTYKLMKAHVEPLLSQVRSPAGSCCRVLCTKYEVIMSVLVFTTAMQESR
jgi:hypothetical protein